jgi:hypothetical protein
MSNSIFFTDGNGTIIGMTDTSYSGKLIIPEYVGGEQIVKIGEWAIYNITGLTSVIIPNSVITIAEGAFEACADLVYVTIPSNVTSIDVNAFHLCQNLTTIYVPDPNNLSTAVSSYDWSTTGSSGVTFMQDPAYIDYLIKGGSLISLSDKIRILSGDEETATNVGKRHGKLVMYKVLSGKMVEDGYKFYKSVNDVWLTKYVPINYISKA